METTPWFPQLASQRGDGMCRVHGRPGVAQGRGLERRAGPASVVVGDLVSVLGGTVVGRSGTCAADGPGGGGGHGECQCPGRCTGRSGTDEGWTVMSAHQSPPRIRSRAPAGGGRRARPLGVEKSVAPSSPGSSPTTLPLVRPLVKSPGAATSGASVHGRCHAPVPRFPRAAGDVSSTFPRPARPATAAEPGSCAASVIGGMTGRWEGHFAAVSRHGDLGGGRGRPLCDRMGHP